MSDPMRERDARLMCVIARLITVADTLIELLSERQAVDIALTDLQDATEEAREALAQLTHDLLPK